MGTKIYTQSERHNMRKLLISLLLLLFCGTAHAGIVSLDNRFNANDVYATDFGTELNENFDALSNGVNNVTTAQIADDTLTEADMADEINPRIRTYEQAICEIVYDGFTVASGGSLTQDIAPGTAYPRGYRIKKASATTKSFTASKWTYVDLDINGDFQYTEVAIGAGTPAIATNSIRLALVSTDSTTVPLVTDLATRSCANASFGTLRNGSTEPTLTTFFSAGKTLRDVPGSGVGFINGAIVSYDSQSIFTVRGGSAYINGQFRTTSADVLVTTGNDDPTNGVSGLDTGAIATSTKYYVYLVADNSASPNYSITYSTSATAPSGLSNYRLIGELKTDGSSKFTSADTVTYHGMNLTGIPFQRKKVVTAFTRVLNAGSGSVSYTGFGFAPKFVLMLSGTSGQFIAAGEAVFEAYGTVGSKSQGASGSQNYQVSTSAILLTADDTPSGQSGVVTSWDSDGFTISWTLQGAPAANTVQLIFLGLG